MARQQKKAKPVVPCAGENCENPTRHSSGLCYKCRHKVTEEDE